MLEETAQKIEDAIRKLGPAQSPAKKEILSLLTALKSEVAEFSKTHAEHAHSIAGLTQLAAHEATRREKSPAMLSHALDGLKRSTEGFEVSHPKLVETLNDVCTTLAAIGI